MSDALLTAIEHHRRGQLPQAEALYRQVLARDPMNADALHLLGVIAHQVGQHAQAEQLIGQAVRLKPGAADFHSNLGETLRALGKRDVAIASYQRAIQLNPEHLDALINLGAALQSSGRTDEAIAAFERVVALQPDHADAWSNLGFALGVKNLAYPAEAACRRAIELNPNHARAHANLAAALQKQARAGEAVAAYRKAIDLEPAMRVAHGNLLLALNYDPAQTPQDVFAEHARWAEQHANLLGNDAPPHTNDRDENRRLRIGYVSPDFRRHSVAFFVEPLLADHVRAAVEIFCYSDAERPDDVTQRIRASADHWRECHGVADDLFANIVRDDRIDILIDLAGHTGGNRLLAFARRSAPVQMTYLGYPNTTGLAAMDFRITDAWADPPGSTDAFHTEQLIRLPRTAWCYQPSREAPPVAPLPVESAGHITFASFNKLAKISPLCLDTWAQLL
ncbi:MAG: hypothetical protein QOE14_2376, partial [Humisphaera sp.]|nr:hypothetical protein [Humisphaera sp.]